MTAVSEIRSWLKNAPEGTTHMLVVTDTFDYSDYPVYVSEKEDAKEVFQKTDAKEMTRVMEIYKLSEDFERQLNSSLAWNF